MTYPFNLNYDSFKKHLIAIGDYDDEEDTVHIGTDYLVYIESDYYRVLTVKNDNVAYCKKGSCEIRDQELWDEFLTMI